MTTVDLQETAHKGLTTDHLVQLGQLFDAEYLDGWGPWNPEQPYGYAAHDVHIIARHGETIVGHAGWARRTINVGGMNLDIAGVGGVLVGETARGKRLGVQLLGHVKRTMLESGGISFGYLGCREEVVPFYKASGWRRIRASESSIGRDGEPTWDAPGQPLMILPIESPLGAWPRGHVDLRGRAW
ncbi:hypothetical protein GCM10027417_23070 [Glutamicibacter endophyticus]